MPELPEVEVSRRAVRALAQGRRLTAFVLRNRFLRAPAPEHLPQTLVGCTLREVERRGKYLLFDFGRGRLLLHLGMSGSLRAVPQDCAAGRHDHVDMVFEEVVLRYADPRRFGLLDWIEGDPALHPRLAPLGIEPLSAAFTGEWLAQRLAGKKAPIKPVLMDARLIVGVGNIYAAESLFRAGIDPRRPAGRIAPARLARLAQAIQEVLLAAIAAGGSTLRDFCSPQGFGDFQVQHDVYGREGQPCRRCGAPIRRILQGSRSTYFCPRCQR
ncbi:MAG: bifunctional DNA-formamidopyrimidine glycosylase/DNA-(apurinic or apyrimidinic site) lyase [Rhodocyclaceae bacterium]|nr:bifunctional DNA-formamidopyrimidine glycosylase/DNA-(apurinic or apyrimidinic site) lyase [Rhodocyclaceae bacterium]